MSHISNYLSYIPKSVAGLFGALLAFVLTFSAIAAPAVRIESTMGVANVTAGDTTYKGSVSAGYDQVVKVQLWYHNMEVAGSGKVAENLSVKFDVPTSQGANQTIRGTVGGTNTNSVTSSVNVNLGRSDAYLEYVPGSAMWRHNVGTNANPNYQTVKVSDQVVTGGAGLVLENAKPCFNFEATVTILLRVRVPSIQITKSTAIPGTGQTWADKVTIQPGDRAKFLFTLINDGNSRLTNVTVGDILPDGLKLVEGTTILTNGNHPNGVELKDRKITDGINIGNFAVGGYSYITFETEALGADHFKCGTTDLVNKGVARSDKAAIRTDTATVQVYKKCVEKFEYACDALNVDVLNQQERKVKATAEISKSNNVTVQGVQMNFGDGTVKNTNPAEHSYAQDGKYTIEAIVTFQLQDANKTIKTAKCTRDVEFKTPDKFEYDCKALNVDVLNAQERKVKAEAIITNSSNVKVVGTEINFGDGTVKNTNPAEHTYAQDGTYDIVATVTFELQDANKTIKTAKCSNHVNFKHDQKFSYDCKALNVDILNKEKREVQADAVITHSDNVVVKGVSIDFGDGTVKDTNPATHSYAQDGSYDIVATVTFELQDANKTVKTAKCSNHVNFKHDQEFSYDCNALNVDILNAQNRTVKADAVITHSDNVVVKGVSIDFGDGTVKDTNPAEHSYARDGSYTIVATVTFELQDGNKTIKEAKCSNSVKFKSDQPKFEYDCNALNLNILNAEKRQVEAKAVITHSDNVKVVGTKIDFGDGTVKDTNPATHTYAKDGKYDVVATVTFELQNEQKEIKTATCRADVEFEKEFCTIPGLEHLPADSPLCKKVLPNTGAGTAIFSLIGATTAAAAGYGYIQSRRTV